MNGYTAMKLGQGRYGVNDLRGAHVTMKYKGRTYLGTVVDQYYSERGCAGMRLVVRHFNGEPWPFPEVGPHAVEVLERDYERKDP